jgi:hypothetical protein
MARPTRAQPSLFDPAPPPPIRLSQPLRADLVALLRILLDEAVAPPAAPRTAAGEVADDDQDHA